MDKNQYRARFFFDNGYGVSVICLDDHGLFEIAVIHGDEDEWEIVYGTDITNDVIPYCSFKKVSEVMEQVKNLPKRNTRISDETAHYRG
jgi:hypothetical protein